MSLNTWSQPSKAKDRNKCTREVKRRVQAGGSRWKPVPVVRPAVMYDLEIVALRRRGQ